MQTVMHSTKEARYAALLQELRDGLARLQPEIPSKYLSDPAVQELLDGVGEIFEHRLAAERSLMARMPLASNDGRRVFLCLASRLGGTTTIGCVRLLRELRAGMRMQDRLVIGIDLHDGLAALEHLLADPGGRHAALHHGVLRMLNERFDADFDEGLLEYRVVRRPELNRLETHLVARQGHSVTVGGAAAVSLTKRDSILTSVRCTFTRSSLTTLLNGVGLELDRWIGDDLEGYAVGVAVPMRREP